MSAPPPRIPSKVAGTEYGALRHAIDARWLMAYAAAVGEADPRYYDTRAPEGPLAHPLFPVCYEWPLLLTARSRTIGEALARLGVHTTHHLVIHRPPRAGDTLLTRARVIAVKQRTAGAFVLVRFTTLAQNGEAVTTTDYGSVFRGVETDGEAEVAEALPAPPRPAAGAVRWNADVEVTLQAAHIYGECSRIWNPIHTDLAIAKAAGLPGPILHGTATLALAVSRLVDRDLGGTPGRVREVSARFTAMVPVPSRFTVRAGARAEDALAFDAANGAGEAVLSDGVVRV